MSNPTDQGSWIKFLVRRGWTVEHGGKHQVKMVKEACRPITLPMHKGRDYAKGMNAALRRQMIENDPSAPERKSAERSALP
ncbi:MAG TPA: type II toxin-antitoxin system HicA family toxin [Conexibacter sp.]